MPVLVGGAFVVEPQYGLVSAMVTQLNGAGPVVVTWVTGPPTAGV